MDINGQFMAHEMGAALPVLEHLLILDPTSRSTSIVGGEQTTWDIPTASGANGAYIDMNSSYISFKLGGTGAAVVAAGAGARLGKAGLHSLISTIDVESSGYTVEHTTDYAQLHSMLSDVNDTPDSRRGYRAYTDGLADVGTETDNVKAAAALNHGAPIAVSTAAAPDLSGDIRFTFPIPSQCLNSGSHLPIHAISQLRYRITWAKGKEALVSTTDDDFTDFRLEEPRLHLCYLETSSASKSVITAKNGGLTWSLPMWETHKANLVTGLSSTAFRIPSHKSSIKTLVTAFQDSATGSPALSNKAGEDSLSRTFPNVSTYQYRLNGAFYPQQEVDCSGGGVSSAIEVMRAFHKTKGHGGMLTRANYTPTTSSKAAATKFLMAQNIESNSGRSNSSFAGVSTLQEAPLVTVNFNSTKSTPQTVFNYVQYDTNHSIVNGIWKVDM